MSTLVTIGPKYNWTTPGIFKDTDAVVFMYGTHYLKSVDIVAKRFFANATLNIDGEVSISADDIFIAGTVSSTKKPSYDIKVSGKTNLSVSELFQTMNHKGYSVRSCSHGPRFRLTPFSDKT